MNVELYVATRERSAVLRSAVQEHGNRQSLYMRIEHEGVVGLGEISPQPFLVNGDPGFDDVLDYVRTVAVPRVLSRGLDLTDESAWSKAGALFPSSALGRFAGALCEMALLDMRLRRATKGFSDVFPARDTVRVRVTGSLIKTPTVPDVQSRVTACRMKTDVGVPDSHFEVLRDFPLPVLLDFNGALPTLEEVRRQVALVERFTVCEGVEQPCAPGDFVTPAQLLAEGLSISLDESIRSVADVRAAVRYGSASMICVKPARVGGVVATKAIAQYAHDAGLTVYVGGFFESSFARSLNARLAAHIGAGPSDVGPLGQDEPTATLGVAPMINELGNPVGHYSLS